jgi:hypothetical protein
MRGAKWLVMLGFMQQPIRESRAGRRICRSCIGIVCWWAAETALVERMLDSLGKETVMNAEEIFEGDFNPGAFEAEAKERWGKTDTYAELAKNAG